MHRGVRLGVLVFLGTWIPLSVWRGLRFGSALRIGRTDSQDAGPLVEGIIQLAAVMLVPAMLAGLVAFVVWMWLAERRDDRKARGTA